MHGVGVGVGVGVKLVVFNLAINFKSISTQHNSIQF
jgi:hypothetical protein